MRNITATEAARNFSDVLDAVEHRNETFVVIRNGHPVARIAPTSRATGRVIKDILRTHPRDDAWTAEIVQIRRLLTLEESRWND
jgi:prevent-host-death family protein